MSVFRSSYNMPPGVFVSDIPGWDDPPMWPDVRCDVCGCFVAYHRASNNPPKNFLRVEEQRGTDKCVGTESDWETHPECPLSEWISVDDPRHDGRMGSGGAIPRDRKAPYWYTPKHGAHEISVYAGQTSWYRCSHCGTEIPVSEF